VIVRAGIDLLDTPSTRAALAETCRRRWTRAEYHRAAEMGLFRPDERLELIGGEVIRKMSPQQTPHATSVLLVEEQLRRVFAEGHVVRVQLPLALGEHSEPEPDASVVVGSIRDYEDEHPSTAVLVVEVADTTVRTDRVTKAGLYAQFGIADYWIVNLPERVLEVHRDPAPMADQPFGHGYRSVTRHAEGATVTPLAAPVAAVLVDDLLPRARPRR
jgi:Uma2 family endonuclease